MLFRRGMCFTSSTRLWARVGTNRCGGGPSGVLCASTGESAGRSATAGMRLMVTRRAATARLDMNTLQVIAGQDAGISVRTGQPALEVASACGTRRMDGGLYVRSGRARSDHPALQPRMSQAQRVADHRYRAECHRRTRPDRADEKPEDRVQSTGRYRYSDRVVDERQKQVLPDILHRCATEPPCPRNATEIAA